MTSTTCNNMNELLRRFAYRTPDKPKAMDKQMSVALLARLYGGVDLEQLVRCGLFTFPAACTAMNRLSGSRKNVLRRTKLLDGSQSVYAATPSLMAEIPEELREIVALLLTHAAAPAVRAHELYCSNIGMALTLSDMERFRPMFGQVLMRGMGSVGEMLRVLNSESLFVNALAPDMVARKQSGAVFFEVDRATEGTREVGRKFADYFEVLRSVAPEEMSESAVVVSSFSYRKEKALTGARKRSLLGEPGRQQLSDGCRFASDSLRSRTNSFFSGKDFLTCAYKGLRFLIVPGDLTWYPESIEKLLPKECGRLASMMETVLRENGRIGQFPVGTFVRETDGEAIRFPLAIAPSDVAGTNAVPFIYENISADMCGRERALKLLTSRNFIRPQTGQKAFLVLGVDAETDAVSFLQEAAIRSSYLYPESDFQFNYLLKQGLYRAFRIVFEEGKPMFDNIGHGFIFKCEDRFFLPEDDSVFARTYLSALKSGRKTELA